MSSVIQQEGRAVYLPSLCEGESSRFSLCGNEVRSAKGREESDLSSIVKEKSMGRQLIWGIGLSCSCLSVRPGVLLSSPT